MSGPWQLDGLKWLRMGITSCGVNPFMRTCEVISADPVAMRAIFWYGPCILQHDPLPLRPLGALSLTRVAKPPSQAVGGLQIDGFGEKKICSIQILQRTFLRVDPP